MSEQEYDIIIIGSGMGGLGAGIQLQCTSPNLRTLIVEQHSIPGGYVSGFTRKGHYFDAGAEGATYVGEGEILDKWFKEIGFSQEFIREKPLEVIHYPDRTITLHDNLDDHIAELVKHFPHEKENIIAYFRYLEAMVNEYLPFAPDKYRKSFGNLLKFIVTSHKIRANMGKTFDKLLNKFIKDEQLKDVLSFFTLWLGMPVENLSATSAGVLFGYVHIFGNHYAKGGMLSFSQNLADFYTSKGGKIRYKTVVKKIIVENKEVKGVQLADDTIIKGKWVISNADLKRTIFDYVEEENLPKKYVQKINRTKQSLSGVSVFLITSQDLSSFPSHMTVKKEYRDYIGEVLQGNFTADQVCIRIPSNIDHSLRKQGQTAVILLALAPYEWENNWKTLDGKERQEEYKKLKEQCGKDLIATAERAIPKLSSTLEYVEVSTPLTFERYTLSTDGSWYGPRRNQKKIKYKTPIPNLVFAGGNVVRGGVPNCLLSGIKTANYIAKVIGKNRE